MKKKIHRELPLEFTEINHMPKEEEKNFISNNKASIKCYQTKDAYVDFFYKPISKMIKFEEKN